MKKVTLILSVIMLATFAGCKKQIAGPAGPAGPQGPQGPAGAANVIVQEITVPAASWIQGCNGSCFYTPVTVSEITSANLDKVAVMVYSYISASNEWVTLPYTVSDAEWYVTYTVGTVYIRLRSASGNTSFTGVSGTSIFKIVVIPQP